jgi:DNA modification methylase
MEPRQSIARLEPFYDDGTVTIYHGDSREILPLLDVDVMVTDPPYGVHHSKHGMNNVAIEGEHRTGRSSVRVLGPEHVAVRDAVLALWGERPALVFQFAPVRGAERPDHPTPKPVALMRDLLTVCPPGVIVDPFLGSGTTLRAAKDLGIRAIGIEVDARHCETAARRMGQEVLDLAA